jgi:hypothetical protein
LTIASQNLWELIEGRNLVLYPDAAMRLAVSRAVAVETSRGWRITKEKQSKAIRSTLSSRSAWPQMRRCGAKQSPLTSLTFRGCLVRAAMAKGAASRRSLRPEAFERIPISKMEVLDN